MPPGALTMSASLFDRFLSTAPMVEAFADEALLQGMLDFEAALVRAQAAEGVIPASAAAPITAACRAAGLDPKALVSAGSLAGTLVVPLVKALTARVAAADPPAAGWVHWGTTSQDVLDTAMVLSTRRAVALLDASMATLLRGLDAQARAHDEAPMLGRTLLQPAPVISVGVKLLSWFAPLVRARERLRTAAVAALRLQLGGAVGTLSVMGDAGPRVAARMAADLNLGLAPGAWHTQRDEWIALACEVGLLCGTLGKVATDIALLSQGEIAEVAEPSAGGRGSSTAMPHKRNPVASMIALAAAVRAPHRVGALLGTMAQAHERGLGNWQAELAEWPGLFLSAHGAVNALAEVAALLAIDTDRMRRNIDAMQGLVFAEAAAALLARHLGRTRAQALLETLSRQALAAGRPLLDLTREAVAASATLGSKIDAAELAAVFDAAAVAQRASAAAAPHWDAMRRRAAALDAAVPTLFTV